MCKSVMNTWTNKKTLLNSFAPRHADEIVIVMWGRVKINAFEIPEWEIHVLHNLKYTTRLLLFKGARHNHERDIDCDQCLIITDILEREFES